jgi:hypothetical protein
MFAITEQNEIGLKSSNRDVIKGWMQPDEPDNAQPSALGGYGPRTPAIDVARRTQEINARDATRPVTIIFGPGVPDTSWKGRGACTGDLKYYDVAVQGADIKSFDIYPVGSDVAAAKGNLEYVAQDVINLRKRAAANQVVWTALETTALDIHRPVKPAELRAEVWMAVIHGAKGICYFVHEFAPTFREDGIFRHPDIVQEVIDINRSLIKLAPVLNSEDLRERVAINSAVHHDAQAARKQPLSICRFDAQRTLRTPDIRSGNWRRRGARVGRESYSKRSARQIRRCLRWVWCPPLQDYALSGPT